MRTLLALIAAAAIGVAAPATADEKAEVLTVNGRGTLFLNSSGAVVYQDYFRSACPLLLAAHESGGMINLFTGPDEKCETGAVDYRRYIPAALANCEGGWRYGECWIVAIGREVVWEGPIKFRKGRWTPKGKRQVSVTLSGEGPNATSGISNWYTVGLLNYSRDGKSAEMIFKSNADAGRCKGTLTVTAGAPSPYTVTCSKIGQITGALDFAPDGQSATGAGRGKNARHVDLHVLPRKDGVVNDQVARILRNGPQS
jgi:hypothetical protein